MPPARVPPQWTLVDGAAWALAALLVTTGTWHFAAPGGFESIVPGFLGSPAFWVEVSGAAELACALSLMSRRTRRVGGRACVILLVVVYPANITMAVDSLHGHGSAVVAWLRLPLQAPLILWAFYIARWAEPRGSLDAVPPAARPRRPAVAQHQERPSLTQHVEHGVHSDPENGSPTCPGSG